MDIKAGRQPLEVRPLDRDYSGSTFEDRYLADADVSRSFFNGVNLSNCAICSCKLNNTEFSESVIKLTEFSDCDLGGSDFVDSLFEEATFRGCSFEKGEWRGSTFRNCRFINCDFDHTTVTICLFVGCEFDGDSLSSAEHRAFYFNVFSRCAFGRPASEPHFSSRNFGVPVSGQAALVPSGGRISIEQLCLLRNVDKLRVIDVIGVAEALCESLAEGVQRRTSTLSFFAKIVRVLTDERRISATSLIYLEGVLARLGRSIDDQDLFAATLGAIVEIRSAIFSVATEAASDSSDQEGPVDHITIRFSETYARRQANSLRDALAEIGGAEGALSTESVKHGSTIIELASTNIISLGAILVSLNFALRQATITVKRFDDLRNQLKKRRGRAAPKKTRKRRATKPNKLPAVIQSEAALPQITPVRDAVRRHGRTLVELDEPAMINIDVRVSTEHVQRR